MRADSSDHGSDVRVAVLHIRNRLTHTTRTSEPLPVHKDNQTQLNGISIGRDMCHHDPLVSLAHGTLECTPQHGVWVYVDHSDHGTKLNEKQLVHRDAVIVRNGDVLSLGNTEITLTFKIQRQRGNDDTSDNNQSPMAASVTPTRHSPSVTSPWTIKRHSPSPPSTPLFPSQFARQNLPNIETNARAQQPPPEYINSPIPGSNWRKKRHSISHVTRMPMDKEQQAAISASQTFARSKPLVPSAPTTPPQKDAPGARHVGHHISKSPQSTYYHVKFKEEPETISLHESIPENAPTNQQESTSQSNQADTTHTPSPPLEYSSSPVSSGMSFLNRLQHSPSSAPVSTQASKPSPPSTPAPTLPFAHTHQYNPSQAPARTSNRPVDLRIQVAKRNAGLASAAAAARPVPGGATSTPTAAGVVSGSSRPAVLARGITIPPPAAPPSSNAALKRRLEFTPPASPVAHQDILRQNQSLLNILKNKYKEEQKLKREQEEWMRTQFPSTIVSSPSGSATVPSMSPIRHDKEGGLEDSDDDNGDMMVPPKAPALLRTVSLGQTQPALAHLYHQPSPRLTQAALASRARKGSFDTSRRHHHLGATATISPRGDGSLGSSSHHQGYVRSSSSSVTSSVSTEPSNHRRVLASPSFTSTRVSAELSDFVGYDDDDADDGLMSFTAYYGDSGLDDPLRTAATTSTQRGIGGRRDRLPSLDDEMAGVLNSPSHASSTFGRHNASATISTDSPFTKEPQSVAKPRARSADVRRTDKVSLTRRLHRLGIDIEQTSTK